MSVQPCTSIPDDSPPRLSFLVPAWNAAEEIPTFVAAYRAMAYANRELILVAGGPDGSFEAAVPYRDDGIVVLEQLPGEGKQGALRKGYAHTTGSVIYLTDIDCRPNDASVSNLVRFIVDGNAQVVTGSCCPLEEQRDDRFVLTHWAVEQATLPCRPSDVSGILGRSAALTREVLDAAGAFSSEVAAGTDYLLAKEVLLAGYWILFVPGHPMPTAYPESSRDFIRRQSRWIRNVFVLGRRYGARREVFAVTRTLALPWVMLGMLGLGLFKPALACLGALLLGLGILNRLSYQRRARLRPHLLAGLQHFSLTQLAALRAGLDIARGSRSW